MKFYEKLDFLINITKTTNSALSMHIALDASHISRLRRGERKLVANAQYIKKMAGYFVRQSVEEYQKNALLEMLKKPADLFDEPEKAVEEVYFWLLAEEQSEVDSVAWFMNGLNALQRGNVKNNLNDLAQIQLLETKANISLYFGEEGKREAVIRFLSIILESKKPCDLLLYSDESMDWMTQDLAFQAKWMALMCRAIAQGSYIKIIHTVSRNLDEMLEAISKWIPLYMTGAIEPFYYPKKRDGIFKRTMFIAPQKVAVCSNSMDEMTNNATNILFKEERAIASLAREFNCYLSLCKPLMRIYTDNDRHKFLKTLKEFENELENSIVNSNGLSLVTMPEHVVVSMLERLNDKSKNEIMHDYLIRKERFFANLQEKTFKEIIKLGEVEQIKSNSIEIGYTGIKALLGVKYRADEYKDHIKNIIHILNTYNNYNVVIDRGTDVDSYKLYVKEDLGVIVEKLTIPHVIFAINEGNITAAFWDYLNNNFDKKKSNRQNVIQQLQAVVELL